MKRSQQLARPVMHLELLRGAIPEQSQRQAGVFIGKAKHRGKLVLLSDDEIILPSLQSRQLGGVGSLTQAQGEAQRRAAAEHDLHLHLVRQRQLQHGGAIPHAGDHGAALTTAPGKALGIPQAIVLPAISAIGALIQNGAALQPTDRLHILPGDAQLAMTLAFQIHMIAADTAEIGEETVAILQEQAEGRGRLGICASRKLDACQGLTVKLQRLLEQRGFEG